MWVPLIEKAWAKLNGSYENIHYGHSWEVIRTFTGAPFEIIPHEELENEDTIWKRLKDAETQQYIVACNTES